MNFLKFLKVGFESVKLAQRAECKFKGKKIILIKPNNYVNNSGRSLLYWKKKEKVSTDNTLVICDDLNLYFGNIKIKSSGTAGGHNGLKDIEEFLGTVNYPRIRIGISQIIIKFQHQIMFLVNGLNLSNQIFII